MRRCWCTATRTCGPLTVAEDLHAAIPGSALVVLPDIGHLGNIEAPEAFNGAVRGLPARPAQLITLVCALAAPEPGAGRHWLPLARSFFGMPPTGKAAEFGYIDMYRINGGRITEAWHIEDIAGLMRQIAPSPESVPT
jgi:hypothetical protein